MHKNKENIHISNNCKLLCILTTMIILAIVVIITLLNNSILSDIVLNMFDLDFMFEMSSAYGRVVLFNTSNFINSSQIVILEILITTNIILMIPSISSLKINFNLKDILLRCAVILTSIVLFIKGGITFQNILSFTLVIQSLFINIRNDIKVINIINHIVAIFLISYICIFNSYAIYESTLRICEVEDILGFMKTLLVENYTLVFIIAAVIMLITNTKIASIIMLTSSTILAIAQSFVFQARNTCIKLLDLAVIDTALSVAGNYNFKICDAVYSAILMSIAIYLYLNMHNKIELKTPLNKYTEELKQLNISFINYKLILLLITTLLLIYPIIIVSKVTDSNLITEVYSRKFDECWSGDPFSFIVDYLSFKSYTIDNIEEEAEKVSINNIEKEISKIDEIKESDRIYDIIPYGKYCTIDKERFNTDISFLDEEIDKPDHIVMILNESFSDYPLDLVDVEIDGCNTLTPYYENMKDNTIKGYLYVPAYLGGTANTEFECMTGLSHVQFNSDVYPYQTVILNKTYSLANKALNKEYVTNGIHNYKGSGYSRSSVWKVLGIDNMYFEDSFDDNILKIKNGLIIPDSELYKKCLDVINKDERTFNWVISMECHGGSTPYSENDLKNHNVEEITTRDGSSMIDSCDITAIHNVDKSLNNFLKELEKRDDKVMVVMYGDHQLIKLDNTVDKSLSNIATPFFIWANYDIPEHENILMSSFYLEVIVSKMAGLTCTKYDEYLLELYKYLPIITKYGCVTNNMEFINTDDLDLKTDIIYNLKVLTQLALDIDKYKSEWFSEIK